MDRYTKIMELQESLYAIDVSASEEECIALADTLIETLMTEFPNNVNLVDGRPVDSHSTRCVDIVKELFLSHDAIDDSVEYLRSIPEDIVPVVVVRRMVHEKKVPFNSRSDLFDRYASSYRHLIFSAV